MKKSDIKHGTEYAIGDKRDREHWHLRRAVAVEEGTVKGRSCYYGYGTSDVTGTRVHYLDENGKPTGGVEVVRNQTIIEEWAPYALRRNEHLKAAEQARRNRADAQRNRAAKLGDLVIVMVNAGIPSTESLVYDERVIDLINEFVPGVVIPKRDEDYVGHTIRVRGPLARGYEDYIRHGHPFKIEGDVLFEALR